MGIQEQIISGANLTRQSITINSPGGAIVGGSTTQFGYSYILLGVSATNTCSIRLYSDSGSIAADASRPSASSDISPDVGLIVETYLDSSPLNFDPPIFGTTFSGSATWYSVSSSANTNITFTTYPIELINGSRSSILISGSSISTSSIGRLGDVYSPKSFLILSASSSAISRLRLYSIPSSQISIAEINRTFISASDENSGLISDIVFDSAAYAYKVSPILPAFNLETPLQGNNSIGYILQNTSVTSPLDITASLHIYSIEN